MAIYTPHKTKRLQKRPPKPKQDKYKSALISAANAKSESAFMLAYQKIDWQTKAAEDFVQAVQLALTVGAHLVARKLAALGAERYPQDAYLKKAAYILAPPKVIARDLPPRPDLRANRDWIMTQSNAHRGKWVALRNGELLATADSFDALANQIADPSGILLTKIF
jgi:hypothetical protein